jgi:Tol biopolymer transport system component
MPAVIGTVRESAVETAGGASAHTTSTAEVLLSELKRHKIGVALAMLTLLIALGGFGFRLYKLVRERQAPTPFQTMALTRITASGNVREAAISPDGKYLVHVADENGKQSLWLKQTAAASSVQIVPPAEGVSYSNPTFSRAGDFIFFLRQDRGSQRAALYQIPVLGGEARKLIADISTQDTRSNIAFGPDGKELAFVRLDATFNRTLLIANVDGSNERTLATRLKPVFLAGSAWSPDGQTIACVEGTFGQTMKLIALRVADGTMRPISAQDWANIVGLAWLADGSGLAISAADKPGAAQLWHIAYPSGEARRITNDLNSYSGVSLAADASALATVQRDESEYLWIAPDGDASRARKIIAEAGDYDQFHWTPDGRLLYVSVTSDAPGIWIINADGTAKKRLTATAAYGWLPSVSPDGRYVYFGGGPGHGLRRMESDGSNPQQLLGGEVSFPQCSPDGKWVVYFTVRGDDGPYLWRLSTAGGEPQQLTYKNAATRPVISPDGRWLACNYLIREPNAQLRIAILPFDGGEPNKLFDVFGSAMRELRWTPDGRAIAYLETRNGVSNIVAQPIDGGQPKQLTSFQSDHVLSWSWSRDGKQLACSRGPRTSDVVLISDFR